MAGRSSSDESCLCHWESDTLSASPCVMRPARVFGKRSYATSQASSAVSRAIDPSRAGAGKENVGIDRVDGQRPDRRQSAIGAEAFPPRPAIAAREQARIAAGENGMRLGGMGD